MNVRKRVKLFDWHSYDANIDIDWPKVQQTIGQDHLYWLLKQPKEYCQLIVDKTDENFQLVAEFYNESTLVQYHLMWAK